MRFAPRVVGRVLGIVAVTMVASACGPGRGTGGNTERPNVRERVDIGRRWNCADNEPCIADYRTFLDEASGEAHPIEQDTLDASLVAIARGEVRVVAPTMSRTEVRDMVLAGLNIGFLVDGLDERPLEVIVTAESRSEFFRETDVILNDPLVGEIPAVLLRPLEGGPFPAIVAVHGHGDDAEIYRDDYHGSEYPGHGYAILILTMRAMGIDEAEHSISHALLRDGFALIGLRSYESLVGLEYLRSRGDIRHDRIGLIGHSGGSSTGNLTIRAMAPDNPERFQAYVSDHHVDFFVSSPIEPYHCETVPALYPYHLAINDLSLAPIPTLTVPYAYPFGMANIFRFFDEHLKS